MAQCLDWAEAATSCKALLLEQTSMLWFLESEAFTERSLLESASSPSTTLNDKLPDLGWASGFLALKPWGGIGSESRPSR